MWLWKVGTMDDSKKLSKWIHRYTGGSRDENRTGPGTRSMLGQYQVCTTLSPLHTFIFIFRWNCLIWFFYQTALFHQPHLLPTLQTLPFPTPSNITQRTRSLCKIRRVLWFGFNISEIVPRLKRISEMSYHKVSKRQPRNLILVSMPGDAGENSLHVIKDSGLQCSALPL